MLRWIKGNTYTSVVTLTDTNITLNNVAASYFADYRWCIIGIDDQEKYLAIKPVSKNDIDLHLYPMEDLHKISMGNGYARITNKSLMNQIRETCGYALTGVKLVASWQESAGMLCVSLSQESGGE